MLIRELFETNHFSESEKAVVDFVLKEADGIREMTTKDIARQTFTSPSTLIRVAHKMGYEGWNDLKEAFLKEEEYLKRNFDSVNANFPFSGKETGMEAAVRLAALKKETIDDTESLLDYKILHQAVTELARARTVAVFAVSNNALIAQEFVQNMNRIRKTTLCNTLQGEPVYFAAEIPRGSCAVVISYSGSTPIMLRAAEILKQRKIPMIILTSLGQNPLREYSDLILEVTTREKLYSKIATFSVSTSIVYLLDLLYSCLFIRDYERNLDYRKTFGQLIEIGRKSDSVILSEDLEKPERQENEN